MPWIEQKYLPKKQCFTQPNCQIDVRNHPFACILRSPGGTPVKRRGERQDDSMDLSTPSALKYLEPLTAAFLCIMEQKFRNVRLPSPATARCALSPSAEFTPWDGGQKYWFSPSGDLNATISLFVRYKLVFSYFLWFCIAVLKVRMVLKF